MAEVSSLKLVMEQGPREGETLKYSSGSLIKLGRVLRGNTIAINDAGISSKHFCIQFDNELDKWTLCDLDSSNGTFLNGQRLKPYVPSSLNDGDCIKIGDLTTITVQIGDESVIQARRNPRRQVKLGAGSAAVVEKGMTELGLGFDADLSRNEVNKSVERRNLRSRGKKAMYVKNEVESLSSRRILRSSKKEEVSFTPKLEQISENLNVDAIKVSEPSVLVEPRRTRGRKKAAVQPAEFLDLDERKPVDNVGKRTRARRKGLQVDLLENVQSDGLKESLNDVNESTQVDEEFEDVKNHALGEDLGTNNEAAQEHVEKLVSPQKDCEGKEVMVDESSLKGKEVEEDLEYRKDSCEGVEKEAGSDDGQWQNLEVVGESSLKGEEVAEDSEYRKDGCEGLLKEAGLDDGQWHDLEKMTLEDFLCYVEVQFEKEIYDKSEKIISDLKGNACKCNELRLQKNENGKGKGSYRLEKGLLQM